MNLRELAMVTILLTAGVMAASAGPLEVSLSSGFARIEGSGLTIRDGKPGAVVTIDKIHIPMSPTEPGKLISEINVQTFLGPAVERKYQWQHARNFTLVWTVTTLDSGDGVTLKTSIYNGAGAAARVQKLGVLETEPDSIRYSGSKSNWYVSTLTESLQNGSLAEASPNSHLQLNSAGAAGFLPEARRFSDYIAFYRDGGASGLAMGAVGKPEAEVHFTFQSGPKRAGLSAISEMNEVLLEPGCWRDSQEIAILARPYHLAITSLLQWVASTHGHRTHRGTLTGWSSRYDQGTQITAQECESVAAAWKSRYTNAVNFDVFQVDDGYEVAPGNWAWNKKFSNGPGEIVKLTTGAGAMAGIWVAPLVVSESTGLQAEHADWFQKNADGTLIAGPSNWQTPCNLLDPTHPGAREFLRKTLLGLKKQGFHYFKIDVDEIDPSAHFFDTTKTRLQVMRSLYEFYRATLGEEVYLVSCSGLTRGAVGYADATRVGPDSWPEWLGNSTKCIHDSIVASGYASVANGVFYATDPDVTYLKPRDKINSEEWQTWHSFVGLMGGQVFISEALEKSESLEAVRSLEILTPQAPEKGWSFSGATDREHRRFGFVARRPYGNFVSMLVWNSTEVSADAPIGGDGVDQIGKQFHVWSFWDEKYWGVGGPSFVFKGITSHSCKVVRLTPVSEKSPVVIGSTLHISMGAAEIADFSADAKTVTIKLNNAGARQGKIVLASAKALQLSGASHCTVESVRERSTGIWEVAISSRDRTKEQRIDLSIGE